MAKRLKYAMTKEMMARVDLRLHPPCPRVIRTPSGMKLVCGGRTGIVGGPGKEQNHYCWRCEHEFGFTDVRGRPITRKEYDANVERRAQKFSRDSATPREAYCENQEGVDAMAKAKKAKKKGTKSSKKSAFGREPGAAMQDERIPKAGTVLHATYKGKEFKAVVKANGILFEGKLYSSVSQAGKAAKKGKETNGYTFWGLDGKTKKAAKKTSKKSKKVAGKKKSKRVT